MQLKSEISQVVANLINSGLSPSPVVSQPPETKCEDVYPSLRRFFTEKAGAALHNRTQNLIHQRNELVGHEGLVKLLAKLGINKAREELPSHGYKRVIDMVNFIGLGSSEEQLSEAVSKVILTINDLAERGYITAAMAPISIIELHPSAWPDNKYIVVSYLAINSAGQTWVDNNLQHISFKEGGMPSNVKDLK